MCCNLVTSSLYRVMEFLRKVGLGYACMSACALTRARGLQIEKIACDRFLLSLWVNT